MRERGVKIPGIKLYRSEKRKINGRECKLYHTNLSKAPLLHPTVAWILGLDNAALHTRIKNYGLTDPRVCSERIGRAGNPTEEWINMGDEPRG